jgi:hypothetical protein
MSGDGIEQIGLAGTHRDLVATEQLDFQLQRIVRRHHSILSHAAYRKQ